MASTKVEESLRRVIQELEGEKAVLNREVGQLRRQVSELESELATERIRVKEVLETLKKRGCRDAESLRSGSIKASRRDFETAG